MPFQSSKFPLASELVLLTVEWVADVTVSDRRVHHWQRVAAVSAMQLQIEPGRSPHIPPHQI